MVYLYISITCMYIRFCLKCPPPWHTVVEVEDTSASNYSSSAITAIDCIALENAASTCSIYYCHCHDLYLVYTSVIAIQNTIIIVAALIPATTMVVIDNLANTSTSHPTRPRSLLECMVAQRCHIELGNGKGVVTAED